MMHSVKMIQSVSLAEEETLKTCKSALRPSEMNINIQEACKALKKIETFKKAPGDKENQVKTSKNVCDVKLKKKKAEGSFVPKKSLKPITV